MPENAGKERMNERSQNTELRSVVDRHIELERRVLAMLFIRLMPCWQPNPVTRKLDTRWYLDFTLRQQRRIASGALHSHSYQHPMLSPNHPRLAD